MKNTKKIFSEKILNFVEGLPRFRKGALSRLQDIRTRQRERATKSYLEKKIPDKIDIKLDQITLAITFEHEDFRLIQKGLKKFFPKNTTIIKFLRDFKKREDSIHALNWYNLGYLIKEKKGFFPNAEIVDNLPDKVKHVSLSFHRIMPSVACILFEFRLTNDVGRKIKRIQNKEHLDQVIFRKFWPITKIHSSYSWGGSDGQCLEQISEEKNDLRKLLEGWVKNSFRWNKGIMETISYIDVYRICGNPTQPNMIKKWFDENYRWLQDFGISINSWDSYFSNELIYTKSKNGEERSRRIDIVTSIDTENKSEFGDFLEYKVRGIAITTILFNLVDKYRRITEVLRSKGFKKLYGKNYKLFKNHSSIQELKKVVTLITRLEQEIDQSAHWISHEISEVGTLKEIREEKEINLGKLTLDGIKYQVSEIKNAAEIIDNGLRDHLSIQSIYVMYKLQKWMFILSIVVTVATIVGVISGWNDLKPLLMKLQKLIAD